MSADSTAPSPIYDQIVPYQMISFSGANQRLNNNSYLLLISSHQRLPTNRINVWLINLWAFSSAALWTSVSEWEREYSLIISIVLRRYRWVPRRVLSTTASSSYGCSSVVYGCSSVLVSRLLFNSTGCCILKCCFVLADQSWTIVPACLLMFSVSVYILILSVQSWCACSSDSGDT